MNLAHLLIHCLQCLLGLFIFLFPCVVCAEGDVSRYSHLDKHFQHTLVTQTGSLKLKLNALLSLAATDEEKAWLIYRWVTYHFKHDSGLASKIGDPAQHSLEKLHAFGGGSCAVYANVTHRLMQMAGLEVKTIYGLVKGGPATSRRSGKSVNHVWNAVKVKGVWKVVDSTWGAGFIGRQGFQPQHSDLFFLLAPEKAILSHFDEADELGYQQAFGVNQLLFARLPEDALYAAAVGLNPTLIVDAVRRASNMSLVSTFDLHADVFRVLSVPVNRLLDRKTQSFVIESEVFEELMIVQGRSWLPLKKSGKVHSLTLLPSQGELLVMGRRPKEYEFEALLGYQVK